MNQTITEDYIRSCLSEARFCEFCADADRAQTVLDPIMKIFVEQQESGTFNPELNWELFLVYGSVISYQGLTKKEKYLQEPAMDFLTEARKLAFEIGKRDLISETEKQIGLCYWRLGQHDNALAYFNTVLETYSSAERETNAICLATWVYMMGVYFDLQETRAAKKMLEKIEPFIEASDDRWLQVKFYTEAAGVHLKQGDFDKAIPFLEKAIELSKETKNNTSLANALNNIALVYLTTGEKIKAKDHIEKAIQVFSELGQAFMLGMALETKSQIMIALGDFPEALEAIDESIKILERSENYASLAESLWTKILITTTQTGDKTAAILGFNDLLNTVKSRLDESYVTFYVGKFTQLFYVESGSNYYEKTENYRRHLLDKALNDGDKSVTGIAQNLGISHQNTSLLLRKYPDLCEEYGVKLRKRATDSFLPKNDRVKKTSIDSFAMRLQSDRLAYLGLKKGKIINVKAAPLAELDLSKPIVIKDKEKKYNCGFLVNDFGMFAFEDGRGNIEKTFMPADIIEAGQVAGFYDEDAGGFVSI